jgi:hypothetical protein
VWAESDVASTDRCHAAARAREPMADPIPKRWEDGQRLHTRILIAQEADRHLGMCKEIVW